MRECDSDKFRDVVKFCTRVTSIGITRVTTRVTSIGITAITEIAIRRLL